MLYGNDWRISRSNPEVNSGKTEPDLKAMKSMAEVSKASYSLFQPTMNKAKKRN